MRMHFFVYVLVVSYIVSAHIVIALIVSMAATGDDYYSMLEKVRGDEG